MKKFLTTIFITMLAVVLAIAPMAGCANECEHDVSSWTVVRAATCSTPGLQEGYCGICYELVQEEIPTDPDAHVYGEWSVTAPSATKAGIAVRTCTECGHYERLDLPVLTDINYTSQVTQRPTATQDGISQYTYTTEEYGDIVFNVTIGSDGIQTVGDAVSVGSLQESHDMIRSVTGVRGDKRVDSGVVSDAFEETSTSTRSFSYELYDTYTHINSNDGSEYWMALDGSEIYGYVNDANNNFTQASDLNYFNGFRYYLTYTDTLSYYYGTENFLSGLYAYAKKNENGDFKESINSDGSYSFSFGTYTLYSGATNGALYSEIEVNFTLSASYTIETLKYSSITYANDSTAYDSSTGTWNSDATFLLDADGNAYVTNYSGLKFVETYEVTQTERQSGETELTSPYGTDTRFYTSFDVTYGGNVLSGDTGIQLVAGTATGYDFALTNFSPSDVIGDTITFYYKTTDSNGAADYTEIDVNTESSVGIFVHLNDSNNFRIKSNITGTITIVVCSHSVTREFTLEFTSNAPSKLYATVYNFSALTGYSEDTPTDTTDNSATIYVGQPLYYKSSLSLTEQGTCSESYTTAVTWEGSSDDYLIVDSTSVTLESVTVGGTSEVISTSSFTAYKTGTYTLTLTSTAATNTTVSCTITVTVVEAPSLDSIFSGTYKGTFSGTEDTINVTFGTISKETTTYTTTDSEGNAVTVDALKCTVIATVDYDGDIEVQLTWYTSTDGATVYELTSGEQEPNTLNYVSSEVLGTITEDKYILTISLHETFNIQVSHNLGESMENVNETAILIKTN